MGRPDSGGSGEFQNFSRPVRRGGSSALRVQTVFCSTSTCATRRGGFSPQAIWFFCVRRNEMVFVEIRRFWRCPISVVQFSSVQSVQFSCPPPSRESASSRIFTKTTSFLQAEKSDLPSIAPRLHPLRAPPPLVPPLHLDCTPSCKIRDDAGFREGVRATELN